MVTRSHEMSLQILQFEVWSACLKSLQVLLIILILKSHLYSNKLSTPVCTGFSWYMATFSLLSFRLLLLLLNLTLRRFHLRGTDARSHTPSIAFRHLPPNSARFGYATEGALFISAQLSTDAVSALRKVWLLIRLWKQPSAQALMYTWDASTQGKKREFRLDSNGCGLFVLV